MMYEYDTKTRASGVKWIKAKSGNTYLCRTDAVDSSSELTESQLKRLCLDESNNPQNN